MKALEVEFSDSDKEIAASPVAKIMKKIKLKNQLKRISRIMTPSNMVRTTYYDCSEVQESSAYNL